MNPSDPLQHIKGLSHQLVGRVVSFRRELHAHPELSFGEHQTAARIAGQLAEIGIPTHTGVAGTGVVAIIEGKGPGATLALRADMDALPVDEESGVEFSSTAPGVMHACGHDVHMANLVGAARILWQLRQAWSGRVVLVFQPAEELLPGGAVGIIASQEFQAYWPDAMLGLHVHPELPAGQVGFRPGPFMASSDELYLTVRGRGGHAALPHTLIDPVPVACQVILALQQLVSRQASYAIPTVLSFGRVVADGATNVIPNEVAIQGTFRTLDEPWRSLAHGHIERIAQHTASAMGAACQVEVRRGYPALINHPLLTAQAQIAASEYLGAQAVVELPIRMTADDFACYAQRIPSVYFRLGVGFPGVEPAALHSTRFVANEEALAHSIGLTAWLAIKTIEQLNHRPASI